MSELAVLIPVLARPENVAPLLGSIRAATPGATVLFLTDPGDEAEKAAVLAAGGEYVSVNGGYATKIRVGVDCTTDPLVMTGADDIVFHPGWFEAARAHLAGRVQVVGLNDLLERPRRIGGHATHFLMTREYATRPTIDGGKGPMHQGYSHNFPDRELVETARLRGVYAYAEDSHVEHRHHLNGVVPVDATYEKGSESFRQDARLFRRRCRLWAMQ